MDLLHEIQIGPLVRMRDGRTCELGKDGKPPEVKHTLALTVQTPQATAEALMELMEEGATVYVVAGTQQYRLGDVPSDVDEETGEVREPKPKKRT